MLFRSFADASVQSWKIPDLLNPIALRPGQDSKQRPVLYVAGGNDQALAVYEASSHASITVVPLDFSPIVVEILGRHSFVLRDRMGDTDPLWSFTDTSDSLSVYFVPATPPAASGGLQ